MRISACSCGQFGGQRAKLKCPDKDFAVILCRSFRFDRFGSGTTISPSELDSDEESGSGALIVDDLRLDM